MSHHVKTAIALALVAVGVVVAFAAYGIYKNKFAANKTPAA